MNKLLIIILLSQVVGCSRAKKVNQIQEKPSDNIELIDTINKDFIGTEYAQRELNRFLKDSTHNLLKGKILIKDKESLISIAEPILFNIYGKQKILKEKPYEIYLFGDYWIMMGTLSTTAKGGTFSIVINRITCEVMGIGHGK